MAAKIPTLPSSDQLRPIAQKYGLRLVVLFGSAARGIQKESGLDIGVLTKHPLNFFQQLNLRSALAPLFPMDVDVAVLTHADPVFGFQVACEGKLLYEREPFDWENWKSYKVRQYWDTGKFRDDLRRHFARRVMMVRHVVSE